MTQKEADALMARWALSMIHAGSGATDQIENDAFGPREKADVERCRRGLARVTWMLNKIAGGEGNR